MEGFAFKPHDRIEINGRQYDCDISNKDMFEAIVHEWPKVMSMVHESQDMYRQFMQIRETVGTNSLTGEQDEEATQLMKEMALECKVKSEKTFEATRKFIYGAIGRAEYEEIFNGRRENLNDHVDLCAYIYNWAVLKRDEILEKLIEDDAEVETDAVGETAPKNIGA